MLRTAVARLEDLESLTPFTRLEIAKPSSCIANAKRIQGVFKPQVTESCTER